MVLRHWSARIAGVKALAGTQSRAAGMGAKLWVFATDLRAHLTCRSDHQPVFVIEARLENGLFVQATGNKRDAEKVAATALLQQIKERKK